MSETATSPQDRGYAGSPMNLLYPRIGFQQWHKEEKVEDIEPSQFLCNNSLARWFIFLGKLVPARGN